MPAIVELYSCDEVAQSVRASEIASHGTGYRSAISRFEPQFFCRRRCNLGAAVFRTPPCDPVGHGALVGAAILVTKVFFSLYPSSLAIRFYSPHFLSRVLSSPLSFFYFFFPLNMAAARLPMLLALLRCPSSITPFQCLAGHSGSRGAVPGEIGARFITTRLTSFYSTEALLSVLHTFGENRVMDGHGLSVPIADKDRTAR